MTSATGEKDSMAGNGCFKRSYIKSKSISYYSQQVVRWATVQGAGVRH